MFDDLKAYNGRVYSGMAIGTGHLWDYTSAVWQETKILPEKWQVHFTALKQRKVAAPDNSGVPLGTQYHWYILADQVVRKTTANAYETEMNGWKFKLGHKRPYWKGFSYTYPNQPTYRQRLIQVLRETLDELEKQEVEECQKNAAAAASAAAVRR